jgi:hypothetical protein
MVLEPKDVVIAFGKRAQGLISILVKNYVECHRSPTITNVTIRKWKRIAQIPYMDPQDPYVFDFLVLPHPGGQRYGSGSFSFLKKVLSGLK